MEIERSSYLLPFIRLSLGVNGRWRDYLGELKIWLGYG